MAFDNYISIKMEKREKQTNVLDTEIKNVILCTITLAQEKKRSA